MYGRSVLWWILAILVAFLVFIVCKWLLVVVMAYLHVAMPDQVATALAVLIAIGAFYGGWRYPPSP